MAGCGFESHGDEDLRGIHEWKRVHHGSLAGNENQRAEGEAEGRVLEEMLFVRHDFSKGVRLLYLVFLVSDQSESVDFQSKSGHLDILLT